MTRSIYFTAGFVALLGATIWFALAGWPATDATTTATIALLQSGSPFDGPGSITVMGMGGMIVTNAALEAIRKTFRQDYQESFETAESFWAKVAMLVMSSTGSNTYGWLGQWPKFREWTGDRVFKDLKEHAYELANRKFESSVEVGRDQIEDDNLGVYTPMFREMGRAAAVFPDELLAEIILAGETGLCYDGQPFFDTEHPVYPNVDGTGSADLVSNLTGAGSNPAWYLLDTKRSVKPFIYQLRRKMEFTSMDRLDDEQVFMSDTFRYGVSTRAEAGYGLWQMARKSTLAVSAANFEAERLAMRQVKADGGRPMGITPNLVMCGPELEPAFEKILKAQLTDSGNTNTNYGKCELLVVDWLG